MKKSSLFIAISACALTLSTLFAQPALALTIQTNASRDTASGFVSDPKGPATTGSLLSEVLVPPSDGGDILFTGSGAYGRGAANDTGAGAVAVDGAFFNGQPTLNVLTGTSILTSELTNSTGNLVPFEYKFFLPGPRLTVSDFAGISDTDSPTIDVFFDFRVSLDFGSGFLANVVSQGLLTGGIVSHTLDATGTNPLGSTFFVDGSFPTNIFGYQFDDFTGSVTGFLPSGQTVAAKSEMFVRVRAPGFETGGAANIGDPLDLSAGAFTGSFTVIPVPAAVWLFGSGLLGLVGLARRKTV